MRTLRRFFCTSPPTQTTTNAFGVRLLPEHLRGRLFGPKEIAERSTNNAKYKNEVSRARHELARFGLGPEVAREGQEEQQDHQERVHLDLPPLCGDVQQHFYEIASQQVRPYLALAEDMVLSSSPSSPTLRPPEKWEFKAGWTRYPNEREREAGVLSTRVPHPTGGWLSFDVEVCVRDGPEPVMATALSQDGRWYGWVARRLVDRELETRRSGQVCDRADLISLGPSDSSPPRLVVGHNVSYDRARVADEYTLRDTGIRYLDTMSLHIAASGMTSGQRMQRMQKQKSPAPAEAAEAAFDSDPDDPDDDPEAVAPKVPKWFSQTSLNNLADVHALYCPDEERISKSARDVFVEGSMEDVREDFQRLMAYCASDVAATRRLAAKVFPVFRERCPHPATLAGMLEMSTAKLPVDPQRWSAYVSRSDALCAETEEEVEAVLGRTAKEACQLMAEGAHADDPWLWNQDWSTDRGLKVKKAKKKQTAGFHPATVEENKEDLRIKFFGLLSTVQDLYKKQPTCPGYPKWYQDLAKEGEKEDGDGLWSPQLKGITSTKKISPSLLRLTWLGRPLFRSDEHKWGYLAPKEGSAAGESGEWSTASSLEEFNDDELERISEIPDYSGTSNKKGKKKNKKENNPAVGGDEVVETVAGPGGAAFELRRLPHKDGRDKNVGNPLAKDFLGAVKQGVLSASCSSGGLADRVLRAGRSVAYWRSNHERVKSQVLVRTPEGEGGDGFCVILPQLVTAGTLTRRAVERTWLTASNAKEDRIGSELRTMVQAPEGYHLVGADVDSQELWIAAVLGDASHPARDHGCTPLGWMTLRGSKSDGTDMHSATARSAGVSRDDAKVLNYGRIYGAGVNFAKTLLQRFNPALTDAEARKLAVDTYARTKGERVYVLNRLGAICLSGASNGSSYEDLVGSEVSKKEMARAVKVKRKLDALFTLDKKATKKFGTGEERWRGRREAEDVLVQLGAFDGVQEEGGSETGTFSTSSVLEILSRCGGSFGGGQYSSSSSSSSSSSASAWTSDVAKLSSSSRWAGGAESHAFNRLEEVALNWSAKTPVLGCRISRALDSKVVGTDYLPSRINWVVQSSAVDYLHLLLVACRWAFEQEGLAEASHSPPRYLISIHDEVRYLCRSEDRYRCARALHLANLLVRAMFCSRLGLKDMPESVCYFSAVDVDVVLRKDPLSACATPSQPGGVAAPRGECLGAEEADRLADGEEGGGDEGEEEEEAMNDFRN